MVCKVAAHASIGGSSRLSTARCVAAPMENEGALGFEGCTVDGSYAPGPGDDRSHLERDPPPTRISAPDGWLSRFDAGLPSSTAAAVDAGGPVGVVPQMVPALKEKEGGDRITMPNAGAGS